MIPEHDFFLMNEELKAAFVSEPELMNGTIETLLPVISDTTRFKTISSVFPLSGEKLETRTRADLSVFFKTSGIDLKLYNGKYRYYHVPDSYFQMDHLTEQNTVFYMPLPFSQPAIWMDVLSYVKENQITTFFDVRTMRESIEAEPGEWPVLEGDLKQQGLKTVVRELYKMGFIKWSKHPRNRVFTVPDWVRAY